MKDFRELAKNYIANGFWVIPITKDKRPAIKKWYDLQTRPMTEEEIEKGFKKCYGIALLMGGPPSLFAVDIDLKYSLNPNLFEEIKDRVPAEILAKTYVQKTVKGGYHWVYKAPKTRMFGNEKFANRYTTAFERHIMYMDYYSDPKTRDNALKIAHNHKSLVLIESRSGSEDRCGGYVIMPPTPGYEFVYGTIQELTEEEYDTLTEIMRSFNEVKELTKQDKKYDNTDWEVNPFEDYNERGDIVSLLLECGWTYDPKFETHKNIRFKRPGATSGSSALFDKSTRIFNCFSTSTSLSVEKGYNPAGLYIQLEHDGDASAAYKTLVALDYGIKK